MISFLASCRRFTVAIVTALTLLLVLSAPAAQVTLTQNSVPNEETPEDRGEEIEKIEEAARRIETRPHLPTRRVHAKTVEQPLLITPRVASVAAQMHPSQFGVRRLL